MPKKKGKLTDEDFELMAEGKLKSEDHFDFKSGKMMKGQKDIQRVNVDFTTTMLAELDAQANALNVSRQSIIKILVRQGLNDLLNQKGRPGTTPKR